MHLQEAQQGAEATRRDGPTVFDDMQARLLEVERENARLQEARLREVAELTERLRLAELVCMCMCMYIYMYNQ